MLLPQCSHVTFTTIEGQADKGLWAWLCCPAAPFGIKKQQMGEVGRGGGLYPSGYLPNLFISEFGTCSWAICQIFQFLGFLHIFPPLLLPVCTCEVINQLQNSSLDLSVKSLCIKIFGVYAALPLCRRNSSTPKF